MEEQIRELLGESYHEGITNEEIQTFFKNSILGDGTYIRKELAEAEKKKLQNKLQEKDNALKAKLTDEEKKKAAEIAKDQELEELRAKLLENTISSNSYKAIGLTAEARINANIKEDDSEFKEFIANISSEDEAKTEKISSYVNKIVKAAYEKGKADITKEKMAKMATFKSKTTDDDDNPNKGIGVRLAQNSIKKVKQNNYFKN